MCIYIDIQYFSLFVPSFKGRFPELNSGEPALAAIPIECWDEYREWLMLGRIISSPTGQSPLHVRTALYDASDVCVRCIIQVAANTVIDRRIKGELDLYSERNNLLQRCSTHQQSPDYIRQMHHTSIHPTTGGRGPGNPILCNDDLEHGHSPFSQT